MFFYEGFSCPVCGKAFVETDDVVACPKCGAPHHRACWQSIGHCALQDDHDTPRQWSRETAKQDAYTAPPVDDMDDDDDFDDEGDLYAWTCPACGAQNVEYSEFCSKCGRERQSAPDWHSAPQPSQPQTPPPSYEYSPFHNGRPMPDPYGGVAHDERMEDVSAEEAVTYTTVNSNYYLPRFHKIVNGNKISWNWAAFLFHPFWLLYRKCFLTGFIMFGLSILQGLAVYPFLLKLYDMIGTDNVSPAQMVQRASQLLSTNDAFRQLFIGVALLYLFDLVLRLFMGFFGNWIYQKTAFARIRKFKEEKPDRYPHGLMTIGGVSFLSAIAAYMCSDFLVQFFFILIN